MLCIHLYVKCDRFVFRSTRLLLNKIKFYFSFIFVLYHRTDLRVDLSKMVRSCYRYKSADLPKSPRTIEELKTAFETGDIMARFGRSIVGANEIATDFFRGVHISDEFSYAVFASQRIIESIEKNITVLQRKYLMDATFKICPYGQFNQFLVIYIEHIETVI